MDSSILQSIQDLDTSAVDELVAIKKERSKLDERLALLAKEEGKISEEVYQRIRKDYDAQAATLLERSGPLKERARQDYARLRQALGEVERTLSAKQTDHEELHVRHRIGEFGKEELEKRTVDVESVIERHKAELAEIRKIKDKFIAGFDSEEELEAAAVSGAPAASPQPDVDDGFSDGEDVAEESADVEPPSEPPSESFLTASPVEPAAPPLDSEPAPPAETVPHAEASPPAETVPHEAASPPPLPEYPPSFAPNVNEDVTASALPHEESGPPSTPGVTVMLTSMAPLPPSDGGPAGTYIMPLARLIPEEAFSDVDSFPVEALTRIGRTPANQIQIDDRTVSRNHAEISLTDEGYVLRDLSSGNGTYVNGDAVDERILEEGDRVQIGTVRFTFSKNPLKASPEEDTEP